MVEAGTIFCNGLLVGGFPIHVLGVSLGQQFFVLLEFAQTKMARASVVHFGKNEQLYNLVATKHHLYIE
jgi:hypothetical protein